MSRVSNMGRVYLHCAPAFLIVINAKRAHRLDAREPALGLFLAKFQRSDPLRASH
jgi:hypothetical protein